MLVAAALASFVVVFAPFPSWFLLVSVSFQRFLLIFVGFRWLPLVSVIYTCPSGDPWEMLIISGAAHIASMLQGVQHQEVPL